MKRQVSDRPACVECRRLHRGCPGVRPCPRCIQLGLECIESVDNRTKKAKVERKVVPLDPPPAPFYPAAGAPAPSSWPLDLHAQAHAHAHALAHPHAHAHAHVHAGPAFVDHMEQSEPSSMPYDADAWERFHSASDAQPAAYFQPPPPFAAQPAPFASSPASSPRSDTAASEDSPRSDGEFFHCPVTECDHAYRRKGDLKTHVLQRHKDRPDLPLLIAKPRSSKLGKPYPCTVTGCPSGFTRKSGLARHLRQKHEGEPESKRWLDAHPSDEQDLELSSGDSSTPEAQPFQFQYPTFYAPQQPQYPAALFAPHHNPAPFDTAAFFSQPAELFYQEPAAVGYSY